MRKYLIFALLLYVSMGATAQRKNIIFQLDYLTGVPLLYENNFKPEMVKTTTEQTRNKVSPVSLKVSLTKGIGAIRSEYGLNTKDMPGEIWVGFPVLFGSDYKVDNQDLLFTQMQAAPDAGENWGNPPFSIYLHGDVFRTELRSNATAFDALKTMPPKERVDLGKLSPGQWLDVVYHIKWGWNNDGIVEVWFNNKKVLERYNYSIGYNDKNNPYFKFGVYEWDIAKSNIYNRSVYFGTIRIGDEKATYKDVCPDRVLTSTITINRFYDGGTEVIDK